MSGGFSAGGLITGIDSNRLIEQLIQLDRQPVRRLETRVTRLEQQRTAIRDLRSLLQTLRNRAQDFRLNNVFNAFRSASSQESVATAQVSSASPAVGAFNLNVIQLASATVANSGAKIGANINPAATLDASGIATAETSGTFTVNGKQITVNSATQSLNDVLAAINGSGAGVTATYNPATDRVTFANNTPGDTNVINFGATGDTSNFLQRIAVTGATQLTGGGGATEATSTRNLGAIDPAALINAQAFASGAITAGTFSINGIAISIDPTQDTIQDVVARISGSDAGVDASYDAATDGIRLVSRTLGSRTIGFGAAGDTSNFIAATNLNAAVQTAGQDAQFTVNGGPILTRNTNEVSDAIGGVTVRLLSTGASTVTVSSDDDAIVDQVREFIAQYNDAVNRVRELTATGGRLAGDGSIRNIESFLRQNIFNQIPGVGSSFSSLVEIGITTGSDFNAESSANLALDEDKFREALRDDRLNVRRLFANDAENGIADLFFTYLDGVTAANGFLNERGRASGLIDQQIRAINDNIARIDDRLAVREARLRRQFTRLEQLSADLQNQNNALARIGRF